MTGRGHVTRSVQISVIKRMNDVRKRPISWEQLLWPQGICWFRVWTYCRLPFNNHFRQFRIMNFPVSFSFSGKSFSSSDINIDQLPVDLSFALNSLSFCKKCLSLTKYMLEFYKIYAWFFWEVSLKKPGILRCCFIEKWLKRGKPQTVEMGNTLLKYCLLLNLYGEEIGLEFERSKRPSM